MGRWRNRTLLQALKKRLTDAEGSWVDILPGVIWAYNTTPREPKGETPLKLAFGTDAVIPAEVSIPSPRVEQFDEEQNESRLRENLDLLDEVREQANIKIAAYQQRIARYYNSKVRPPK
jgi:hypothetical protein